MPADMVTTVVPLDVLWKTGCYKDWIILEMPKSGCVNVHISRVLPGKSKPKDPPISMPLFRSIPRFDPSDPESPTDTSPKTPEITLTALGSKPSDFHPFCHYAFLLGLETNSDGRLDLEDICYSSVCMHPTCIDINRTVGSELARLRGNIRPKVIYATPEMPPYVTLSQMCFPSGLQVCFHTSPPESHCFEQILEPGLVAYLYLFYAAVNGVDLGLRKTRTIFIPTVLGLITEVKDMELMTRIADTVVYKQIVDTDRLTLRPTPLHQDSLIHLTQEIPLPQTSLHSIRFTIQGVTFDYRGTDPFSPPFSLSSPTDINPDILISTVTSLLSERKILLLSTSESKLSRLVTLLLDLIYPFEWPHIVIPVLPLSLLDVLSAPRPMLVGINEVHMPAIAACFPDIGKEALIIRLDNYMFSDHLMTLPKTVLASLKRSLLSENRTIGSTREAFLRLFSSLMRGYKDHIVCSSGVNYINSQAFLQSLPSIHRPFMERFMGTSLFIYFLQRHANREKYAFHRLMTEEKIQEITGNYTIFVVPALPETCPTTSSSGSYYRDVLPSPRRAPAFNTSVDFSYSDSEEEEEPRDVSFRPVGLPTTDPHPPRYYLLPDTPHSCVPKDLSSVLPQRSSGFTSSATPAISRLVSPVQSLIFRLMTMDPPQSVCGQLLRLMMTSNVEPGEMKHFCTALRGKMAKELFLDAVMDLVSGRAYEVRYRTYTYLSQAFNTIILDCLLSGDYLCASRILPLSDHIYYLTPTLTKEYLIDELAGVSLWSCLSLWQSYIHSETAFNDLMKVAALMTKLDIELATAKKLILQLSVSFGLDEEQRSILMVLTGKLYKARMREMEEDLG